MKTICVLCAFLTLSGCVQFDRQWTTENRRLEVAYQTLHAIDGLQTLHVASDPEEYREKNPLLGEHPTTGAVLVWYMATSYGHTFITDWLDENAPRWACRAWQAVTIGESFYNVQHNYQLGLTLGF